MFKVGQRVRYVGRICPSRHGQHGWVKGNKDGWVLVQFDDETNPTKCAEVSLVAVDISTRHPVALGQITIGETGPDWEPGISGGFYAQRGIEGQFAFGRTEEEALKNLIEAELLDKAEQRHDSQ